MKKILCLAAGLLALNLTTGFAQNGVLTIANNFPSQEKPVLTKFNLDFPGGTPQQLVAAIEKATGKPLNAIVADEDSVIKLPPLKLNEVTFPQLSDTLKVGSSKTEIKNIRSGNGSYYGQQISVGYQFTTIDSQPSDNSVWFFRAVKYPEPLPAEKVCQYYSLVTFLDRGFTVDDITTAIQTGWKMAGVTPVPELNYHKETKMLIAYGEPEKLETIGKVLATLPSLNQEIWRTVNDRLNELERQVKKLKAEPSAPKTNAVPEEKSGK